MTESRSWGLRAAPTKYELRWEERAAGSCGACGKGRHRACSEASSKRQMRSADLERGGRKAVAFAACSVPKKGGCVVGMPDEEKKARAVRL